MAQDLHTNTQAQHSVTMTTVGYFYTPLSSNRAKALPTGPSCHTNSQSDYGTTYSLIVVIAVPPLLEFVPPKGYSLLLRALKVAQSHTLNFSTNESSSIP